MPLLLSLAALALLAWVAVVQSEQPARLAAGLPLALVLTGYLLAGRRSAR